jgi:hypothetical protein
MAKEIVKKKIEKTTKYAPPKSAANALPFVFGRVNYILMVVGVLVILIGFLLMSGGATADPNVFPDKELYSFQRITLAPIIVMLGFGIEIVAILKRPA